MLGSSSKKERSAGTTVRDKDGPADIAGEVLGWRGAHATRERDKYGAGGASVRRHRDGMYTDMTGKELWTTKVRQIDIDGGEVL